MRITLIENGKTSDSFIREGVDQHNSISFAEYLNSLEGRVNHLLFVIGGPYGFSEKVYSRADARISLSKLTFSHQLIRVIFMEQLYRAFTIRKGEPYHHA